MAVGSLFSPRTPCRKSRCKAGSQSRWGEPFDSWRAGNFVGTPEQVSEKIRTYLDLGCTGFVPWCSDYPDDRSLRLFAEKVMPHLRHLWPEFKDDQRWWIQPMEDRLHPEETRPGAEKQGQEWP